MPLKNTAAVLMFITTTASADILNTFTDPTAYNNATSNLTSITFDGFGLSDSDAMLHSGFDTTQNLFIDGEILLTGKDHSDGSRNINPGFSSSTFVTTDFSFDGVTFVLDAPATAFSLDLGTLIPGSPSLSATVELSSGATFSLLPTDDLSFVGFTLDTPEDEISIYFDDIGNEASDNRLAFDNLTFGEASPIPAPAAGLLAVIGLGSIAALRRKKT